MGNKNAMRDGTLAANVTKDDANGFMCAWHYVNHYLGTPDKWLDQDDQPQMHQELHDNR